MINNYHGWQEGKEIRIGDYVKVRDLCTGDLWTIRHYVGRLGTVESIDPPTYNIEVDQVMVKMDDYPNEPLLMLGLPSAQIFLQYIGNETYKETIQGYFFFGFGFDDAESA